MAYIDVDNWDPLVDSATLCTPAYGQQSQPKAKSEPIRLDPPSGAPQLGAVDLGSVQVHGAHTSHVAEPVPVPRVAFSYVAPTELHTGPTRVLLLPPFDSFGRDSTDRDEVGKISNTHWAELLMKSPSSIYCTARRPQARPPLEDVVAKLRARAERDRPAHAAVAKSMAGVRVVPQSVSLCVTTVHSLMLNLLDASFTIEQAACDFLLLSMFREEVRLGVYTTPPQLVLQLRRRLALLRNPKHINEGEAVIHRMDGLLKVWRQHWRTRTFGGCHDVIEAMRDKEEEREIQREFQSDPARLMRDRFICGAGEYLPVTPDADMPKQRMKLLEAVQACLLAPQAYPAFVLHNAHPDDLNYEQTYLVAFVPLKEGLDIHPSAKQMVFVRNWAVPFANIPDRFTVPSTGAGQAKPPAEPPRVPLPDAPPKRPEQSIARQVMWSSSSTRQVGTTRYFPDVQVLGNVIPVGSDAYVADSLQHNARQCADHKVMGRIWQLSDEGESSEKTAWLRLWVRKGNEIAKKIVTKSDLQDYMPWEVFATDVLLPVPVEKLRPIEVRALGKTVDLPDIATPPAEVLPDAYPTDIAKRRLTLAASEDKWSAGFTKDKVITLKLVCRRRCDAAKEKLVQLRQKRILVLNRTPTPVGSVKGEPVKSEAVKGGGETGRGSTGPMPSLASMPVMGSGGEAAPRAEAADTTRTAADSLTPPPPEKKRLRLLPRPKQ